MKYLKDKTNQKPEEVIKVIMKREKRSASKLAKELNVSDQALRKRLGGKSKFPADEFMDILDHLGYKAVIVKKEDVV